MTDRSSSVDPTMSEPPAHPRAGRNLIAATAVAVGLGVVLLLSIAFSMTVFAWLVCVAVVVAVVEIGRALAKKDIHVPWVLLAIGAGAIAAVAYFWGPRPLTAVFVAACALPGIWLARRGPENFVRDITASVFVLVYIGILGSFASLMARQPDGAARIITLVILVACNDIGGYAVGVLFGRHPMAPVISPKKSWEGFGGSAVLCAVGGAVCVTSLLNGTWWQGILLGLAVLISATAGDLTESLIKRDIGVKDMGALLPGHGGLLDRVDSLLLSAPVVWAMLSWIAHVG